MGKNIIFYFSGTGNSLMAAQRIGETIGDCDIINMGSHPDYRLEGGYDRIGFIFPIYFQGLPACVESFIKNLTIGENTSPYYFGVATYGLISGVGKSQVGKLLKEKGVLLNYGMNLKMFSNYVVGYNMSKNVEGKTKSAEEKITTIGEDILTKKEKRVGGVNPLMDAYYKLQIKGVKKTDLKFHVESKCTSCGICEKVCSVGNIKLVKGKPEFQHHCEGCLACLQHCPVKAINYSNYNGKTEKRRRYVNPEIGWKILSKSIMQ